MCLINGAAKVRYDIAFYASGKRIHPMFLRVLTAMAVIILASCGTAGGRTFGIKPYRIEIQQGNFISQEMVSKLKLGMSKDQVRYLLGTPLITDSFHAERWDYVFRRQKVNSTELEHRKLAVFFEDGRLKRIEGDVTPAAAKAVETRPVLSRDMSDAHTAPLAADKAKPREKY